jgi:hypothetical protein
VRERHFSERLLPLDRQIDRYQQPLYQVTYKVSSELCKVNFFMYHACLGMHAKSSGTGFRAGVRVPTDEHGLL